MSPDDGRNGRVNGGTRRRNTDHGKHMGDLLILKNSGADIRNLSNLRVIGTRGCKRLLKASG
jgi:hypothetical protein